MTQDSIGHLKMLCMSVLSLAEAFESEWKRYSSLQSNKKKTSVRVWIQLYYQEQSKTSGVTTLGGGVIFWFLKEEGKEERGCYKVLQAIFQHHQILGSKVGYDRAIYLQCQVAP